MAGAGFASFINFYFGPPCARAKRSHRVQLVHFAEGSELDFSLLGTRTFEPFAAGRGTLEGGGSLTDLV